MQITYHKITAKSPASLLVSQLDTLVTPHRNQIRFINDADNQLSI